MGVKSVPFLTIARFCTINDRKNGENMVYGYARVSTTKQNIERQLRNIRNFDNKAVIYQDEFTGTTSERPEWQKLKRSVERNLTNGKQDITIVFDSVSRMSRNAEEGVKQYFEFYDKGIELVFLKEPQINTETYKKALSNNISMTGTKTDIILKAINDYLMVLAKEQIMLAFEQAEKEVTDLRQRTSEGIRTAKLSGKQIGHTRGTKLHIKKEELSKQLILQYSKDFGGSLNDPDVIKLIGNISRNTYYKYKRELRA